MKKIVFDKIRETTHIKLLNGAGAFRSPGEVCTVSRADAESLILRGLASPWPNTGMGGPVRDTSIQSEDVYQKKEDGGALDSNPEASPLLFVVIPTKGGRANDLKKTLASIFLEPPGRPHVCVVFDGHLEDETREVVRWWQARLHGQGDPAFLTVAGRSQGGNPNMARDVGIQGAPAGAIIVEVDDHDVPEPGALRMVQSLFRNPTIQAVYGDHYVVAPEDYLVRVERLGDYYDGLFCEMCPSRGLRAYRRTLYYEVGGYRENEFPAGDHFLWLRFAELLRDKPGAIFHVQQALARFKMAGDSISLRLGQEQAQMSERAVLAAMTGTLLQRPASDYKEPELPDYSDVTMVATANPKPYRGTVIVVPCYRSQKDVPRLLESMTPEERAATVLVIDGEPDYGESQNTARIVLSKNTGFAHACNVGATMAMRCGAEYICFLNADTQVQEGWLDALIEEQQTELMAGIVGGRQLDGRGLIHSCGSEWSYGTQHFEHVIRGQRPDNQPEWTQSRILDMITASCILMPISVFDKIDGFDERYRMGYWEDSDLCMKVRNAGYPIIFTPESTIVHYQGGSGLGSRHRFYRQNAELCKRRWVETGLVDKFARARGRKVHGGDIVACYIVLNEEEFIQASIESIYPLVDRIVIVEGGNDYAVGAGLCGADKRSTDRTVERIKAVDDPEGKIELIQGAWRDKAEQRQAYAEKLKPGDWMLLMDGDEVFYEAGLWRLSYLMHSAEILRPMFDLFWNDFRTLGTGIWDQFPQVKVLRWKEGYHYRDHNCPCDANGNLVVRGRGHGVVSERLYAHYAWVKPLEKLRKKAAYYERQPGARERIRPNYIDRVFLPWRDHPLKITQEMGTHPFGNGGAAMFNGKHPEPIRRRLEKGEFQWV